MQLNQSRNGLNIFTEVIIIIFKPFSGNHLENVGQSINRDEGIRYKPKTAPLQEKLLLNKFISYT